MRLETVQRPVPTGHYPLALRPPTSTFHERVEDATGPRKGLRPPPELVVEITTSFGPRRGRRLSDEGGFVCPHFAGRSPRVRAASSKRNSPKSSSPSFVGATQPPPSAYAPSSPTNPELV